MFVKDGFVPDPKLDALLKILKFAFPAWRKIKRQSESDILTGVARVVEKSLYRHKSKWLFQLQAPVNRLVQAFYTSRVRNSVNRSIFFLDSATDFRSAKPRLEILQSIEIIPNL